MGMAFEFAFALACGLALISLRDSRRSISESSRLCDSQVFGKNVKLDVNDLWGFGITFTSLWAQSGVNLKSNDSTTAY